MNLRRLEDAVSKVESMTEPAMRPQLPRNSISPHTWFYNIISDTPSMGVGDDSFTNYYPALSQNWASDTIKFSDDTVTYQGWIDSAGATFTKGDIVHATILGIGDPTGAGTIGFIGRPHIGDGFWAEITGQDVTPILTVTDAQLISGTATLTGSDTIPFLVGMNAVVSGMTNTAYNGTQVIGAVGGSTFSFSLVGSDTTSASDDGSVTTDVDGTFACAWHRVKPVVNGGMVSVGSDSGTMTPYLPGPGDAVDPAFEVNKSRLPIPCYVWLRKGARHVGTDTITFSEGVPDATISGQEYDFWWLPPPPQDDDDLGTSAAPPTGAVQFSGTPSFAGIRPFLGFLGLTSTISGNHAELLTANSGSGGPDYNNPTSGTSVGDVLFSQFLGYSQAGGSSIPFTLTSWDYALGLRSDTISPGLGVDAAYGGQSPADGADRNLVINQSSGHVLLRGWNDVWLYAGPTTAIVGDDHSSSIGLTHDGNILGHAFTGVGFGVGLLSADAGLSMSASDFTGRTLGALSLAAANVSSSLFNNISVGITDNVQLDISTGSGNLIRLFGGSAAAFHADAFISLGAAGFSNGLVISGSTGNITASGGIIAINGGTDLQLSSSGTIEVTASGNLTIGSGGGGVTTAQGDWQHTGAQISFLGAALVSTQTVSGDIRDGTALQSLINALVAFGLISDMTTNSGTYATGSFGTGTANNGFVQSIP